MHHYYARLFRYTEWANRRVLAALRAYPAALPEALPLFAHVLGGEHAWLCRLNEVPMRIEVWPTLTLDECEAIIAENVVGYAAVIAATTDFAATVHYERAGVEYDTAVGDILTHIATHGGYHRGQVAKAIGRAGGTSVNTDFMQFVREGL